MTKPNLRVYSTNWGMWEARDSDGRLWFTSTSRDHVEEYVRRANGQSRD